MVALFHDGLGGWATAWRGEDAGFGAAPWSADLARGFARLPIASLPEQVRRCRDLGGERFTVLACGAAVEWLGLDLDALVDGGVVDDVVGLPTIWRRAASRRLVSI
jgi:hypothetical protein